MVDREAWHATYGSHPHDKMVRLNSTVFEDLRLDKTKPPDAVPTPFPTLNNILLGPGGQVGLPHGHQVIVAAGSGQGKTIVALNMVVTALRTGENVVYFMLEGEPETFAARLAAIVTGAGLRSVTRGRHYDIEADESAARAFIGLPGSLFFNPEPMYELDDIRDVIERFHTDYGVRTFIVDHLQLAKCGTERAIFDRVTEISHVTRTLAVRHKLLSISLSQLNRLASRNRQECPCIHDLLGGTSIESDASLVALVDHCTKHSKYDPMRNVTTTDLIVGKNRNGPPATIPIAFEHNTSRVREALPDEEGQWP